jgi:hypothetical protein
MNPKIENKLRVLSNGDENLFECLKELYYFEVLGQKDYTSVYEGYISQFAGGIEDETN